MTTSRKLFLSAVVLAAAAGLSACGGGGGGNSGFFPIATTPTTPPPASNDPFDAFVAFVKGLTDTAVDTTEPVGVTQFDPAPNSEVQEPVAVQ